MTPASSVAIDAARQLWARASGDGIAPEEAAATAERVHSQLRAGLVRWIGAEGYRALLDRALALAEPEHPALGSLAFLGGDELPTTADERSRGAAGVATGMVALVAAMIELLGRIIGEELAVRLVEQLFMHTPRGVMSTETEGGRDG